jgi:starch synthase (maltosyl-transferring)
VLAATLGGSYGIYGPAFELADDRSAGPGQEEYLNSEKYEIRAWRLDDPVSLAPLIRQLNAIRHAEPAFGPNAELRLWPTDNPELIAYSRHDPEAGPALLVVVNLDPVNGQSGFVTLETTALGIGPGSPFVAHDLLDGARYPWRPGRNYVALAPGRQPAHVLRIEPATSVQGGAP